MPETISFLLIQLLGFAAMGCFILSLQFSAKGFFAFQAIGSLVYVVHYLLLYFVFGNMTLTMALTQGLAILRIGAVFLSERIRKEHPYLDLLLFSAVQTAFLSTLLLTWESDGIIAVVVLVAHFAITAAMWTQDTTVIRRNQLFLVSPLILVSSAVGHSIPGAVGEVFNMASSIIALVRSRKHGQR